MLTILHGKWPQARLINGKASLKITILGSGKQFAKIMRDGMTDASRVQLNPTSRRTILLRGVACAAGATALLIGQVRHAAAKMAQLGAAYQDSPKGDQQCNNCSLFQPPSSCQLVEGTISPSGWCKLWIKKAG